ncbi:MAG: YbaN family protein [Varibaculum sp.]|nr:YbaN family protein [Varibaculum sp.]
MKHTGRVILLVLGFVSLGLAFAGAALPVIPATPFLIVALFCFDRSSERWHNWLRNHRFFGSYLREYERREMRLRNKLLTVGPLWLGVGLSFWFAHGYLWVTIVLAIFAAAMTVHLFTLSPDKD